jgi:hypothetical protein
MAYFAVIYYVVDNYVEKRAPHRQEHLRLLADAHRRGEIVMGGAFSDPVDRALLVFRADDPSIAEHFVRHDPYVIAGLVTRWEIRPWTVVVGDDRP